jgi:hypothetical protein
LVIDVGKVATVYGQTQYFTTMPLEGKQGPEGEQGPEGKQGEIGPQGPAGPQGSPGIGLEKELTRIYALSWLHAQDSPLSTIYPSKKAKEGEKGVVIGFTNPVFVSPIDSKHVFRILVERDKAQNSETGLLCLCQIKGVTRPVEFTDDGRGYINKAWIVDGPMARGVAFLFDGGFLSQIKEKRIDELRIRLNGDFVLDSDDPQKARAIDAEFVRAELPTGDRPRNSEYGIQGGIFESWFTLKQG